MERRIEESGDSESFRLASRFLSAAIECEVDRQGRIVIPPTLRRHAKLSSEVIIVGNRHHVEIWNPGAMAPDLRPLGDAIPRQPG